MFGTPQLVDKDAAIFHTVWTYAIKALDGHKKAHFACDGSPWSGQARILDETYANSVDQTSSRLFYAVAVAENLLVYGVDVSNAFAEAPPPKQGFYICRSPNWNKYQTGMGSYLIWNTSPNRYGDPHTSMGIGFFKVFSVTHKISLFLPKI
jgi:hypothetical protein